MQGKDNDFDAEEGARPSSLISVHKLSTPDPLYDLQLMRELEIINARTRAELGPRPHGGVPVQPKRKPMAESPGRDWLPAVAAEPTEEDETMKIQDLAMVAALGVVTVSSAVAQGGALLPVGGNANEQVGGEEWDWKPTSKEGEKPAKPMLGPEYKKIRIFSHFRKKLIEDGWIPVPNPECPETVLGGDYEDSCRADPDSISCRLCALVPETWKSTSDGYTLTRYVKDGVPLSVTAYGDISDLDEPGRYGLAIVGWEYSESLNAILLD